MAHRHADGAVRRRVVEPRREQHVARLEAARGAGRAARGRNASRVEQQKHPLALNIFYREARVEWQAFVSRRAGQLRLRYAREHAVDEIVAQRGELSVLAVVEALLRDFRGLAEADDAGHVLRAGAQAELLPAPVQRRDELYAAAHVERAETLRAVHLVRRHRHHVDRQLLNVHLYMSRGLHAVRVEHDAVRAADLAERADGLYSTYLVVRRHNRRENRVGADGLFELLRRHHAAPVDGQYGVLEAHLSEPLDRIENRVVLYRARDYVVPFAALAQRPRRALNREVVGLAARAGENYIRRLRVYQRRDLRARRVHSLARLAPEPVQAVRVAVALREVGKHRLRHPWVYPRRRRIIKINFAWFHLRHLIMLSVF